MEKRYYWLQLKDDFFDSDQMDYVREQENGAEYLYIYLRLCFMAANNGGVIERRVGPKVMAYSNAKLAEVVKSTPELVGKAITLFKEIGLAEATENGAFRLVRASEMVGAETAAASKKRKQRAEKKAQGDTEGELVTEKRDNREDNEGDNLGTMSPECPSNVPEMSPSLSLECPQNVPEDVPTKNKDKRLEIRDRDKEREEEKDDVGGLKGKSKGKKPFWADTLIDALPYGEELKNAIRDWADMRRKMKSPFTERAFQIGMDDLQKFGGGSEAKMVAIVNRTILNGWKGFFQRDSDPSPTASSPDRREQMRRAVEEGRL